MKTTRVSVSRREFVIGTTTLGAGFSLGLYLPFAEQAGAADGAAGGQATSSISRGAISR